MGGSAGSQPRLEHGAQAVAEVADEAAEERRAAPDARREAVAYRRGSRAVEPRECPTSDPEVRLFDDRDGVRGEEGPPAKPSAASGFEQCEPGQIAETFSRIGGSDPVERWESFEHDRGDRARGRARGG